MAQKTKTKNNISTPYNGLKSEYIYKKIDKAILDLIENQDLIEQTPHEYVVGYITLQILKHIEKEYRKKDLNRCRSAEPI